jgi:hypothetical protein
MNLCSKDSFIVSWQRCSFLRRQFTFKQIGNRLGRTVGMR